jgi:glycine cleavage system H protein
MKNTKIFLEKNFKFTKNHEWIRKEKYNIGYVGITDFAQKQLGDIVFLEVNCIGEILKKNESFGIIEAVKTVSDMFMPVSGKILLFNKKLKNKPELVNKFPYNKGWIIKIKFSSLKEYENLLSLYDYENIFLKR